MTLNFPTETLPAPDAELFNALDAIHPRLPLFIGQLLDGLQSNQDKVALSFPVTSDNVVVGAARIPRVTALPSSPGDGNEILYSAGSGVQWRLRYDAASGFWEYCGGPPLRASVATDQQNTAGSVWQDIATVGPDVTAPLAGDWDLEFGFNGYGFSGGAFSSFMGIAVGAGASPTGDTAWFAPGAASGATDFPRSSPTRFLSLTGLTAGQLLRARYQTSGAFGAAHFTGRWIAAWPKRVQ